LLLGFMYTFLVRDAHLDSMSALISNALAVLILAAIIPVGGALSDRVGRKMVLTAGAIWIACAAYPAILLAASGTFSGALMGQTLVAIGIGLYGGAAFTAAVEFFPTSFRATGHAVAYQLAVAIFGGTTPLIATWLVGHFATPVAPGYYVIAVAVIGVVAIQFVPETKSVSLRTAAADRQPSEGLLDEQTV
jgi:MHS family proline/betaine transporter-like MFS transporter